MRLRASSARARTAVTGSCRGSQSRTALPASAIARSISPASPAARAARAVSAASVKPVRAGGILDVGPRCQRRVELGQGLGRRQHLDRLLGRAHRPDERPGAVLRRSDVVRHLCGAGLTVRPGLERCGIRRVEPLALAGEEVVVDGGALQVVGQGVRAVDRREQPTGHGETDGAVHRRLVEPDKATQQTVRHGMADDRGGLDDRARLVREAVEPADEQVGEGAGHAGRVARAVQPGRQRPHEVRVAAGAAAHVRGDVSARGAPGDVGHERGHLLLGEWLEVEAVHGREPPEVAEQPSRPGAPGQPFGAHGRDDEQPFRAHAAEQEAEEGCRRRVEPLEVLDHHDDGATAPAQLAQQGRRGVEDPKRPSLVRGVVAHGCAVGQRGHEGGRGEDISDLGVGVGLLAHGACQVDQREVGQPRFPDVDALRPQHEGLRRCRLVEQRAHEAGLADPGLAGEQHRSCVALGGARESVPEGGQLSGTADEW